MEKGGPDTDANFEMLLVSAGFIEPDLEEAVYGPLSS
jgi:hypothetical protein